MADDDSFPDGDVSEDEQEELDNTLRVEKAEQEELDSTLRIEEGADEGDQDSTGALQEGAGAVCSKGKKASEV